MRTGFDSLKGQAGFTILEVIVTLIVASILGAILLEFMGTNVQQSFAPVYMAQDSMEVNQIMEKMNADYKRRLLLSSNPLEDFKSDVESGNAMPEPYYGDYTYQTSWIRFSGGSEVADAYIPGQNLVLKVTITHNNRSVTALFTK